MGRIGKLRLRKRCGWRWKLRNSIRDHKDCKVGTRDKECGLDNQCGDA